MLRVAVLLVTYVKIHIGLVVVAIIYEPVYLSV